jgi:uncharacterized damage-inducible protein DinB
MPHPLVLQLRFTRSEFCRALAGVSDADARRQFPPINCISWNIGHLAWQEQRYWLTAGQGQVLVPELKAQFAYGAPASTPPLDTMWQAWHTVTAAADPWLDTLTTERLESTVSLRGWSDTLTLGSLMLRVIYHYWFHTGEIMAVRQLMDHPERPDFVGDIDNEAPYRRE